MAINKEKLVQLAREARDRAYTPYSHFKVGCALVDQHEQVHLGCNIENAAYGPTNCAERTALFRAIADGVPKGRFKAMAVIGDTQKPIAPCGICRQVMVELCAPDMPVYLANLDGEIIETTVEALLPGAFTSLA